MLPLCGHFTSLDMKKERGETKQTVFAKMYPFVRCLVKIQIFCILSDPQPFKRKSADVSVGRGREGRLCPPWILKCSEKRLFS